MPIKLANQIPLAPQNQRIYHFIPTPGGTGLSTPGITLSATGTATAYSLSTTNRITINPTVESLVTTASTTAVAGLRTNYTFLTRADIGGIAGGFYIRCRWRPATGMSITTHRAFCGVFGGTSAPTDSDQFTLNNIIGMGWRSGDANLSMMWRASSGGSQTFFSSGFPRPSADRSDLYEFELYAPRGGNAVHWTAINLVNGTEFSGTIDSGLPALSTVFSFYMYASVGGTSSVIGIGLCELYIVSGV